MPTADALDKDFTTATVNMLKVISEGMNKSQETTETAPDTRVEMESLQKPKLKRNWK